MRILLSLAFLVLFTVNAQAQLPSDFDEVVMRDMEKWHAPGLGLAIVKDGETILAKGYGVKSFKTNEAVNENTLFQAGSTTKAFAAMSIAMLIDQGKANWDDPIIKHIPEFKMSDPYVQQNLTIRDALSHRSGVGALSNINMFIGEDLDETIDLMASVDQQASFRQEWDYNNTTFALSGEVVERISGVPFHQFVRDNILTPLGMNDTFMLDEEVRTHPNRAQAHQHYDGHDYEIPYPYIEYTKSAGMMNSTPVDMTKWMKFLLADGVWDGERLVSSEHIKEMMTPQILLSPEKIYPAAASYDHNYYSYGLAWFVHDYKGQKLAMHTGSIDGMVAIIGVMPEKNVGVYVFINSDHIEYRHALMYSVLDILLENEKSDWSDKLYQVYHPENTETPDEMEYPAVDQEDLVGDYTLAGSYPLSIVVENGKLKAKTGILEIDLSRQDDNRFVASSPDTQHIPWKRYLGVELDENGKLAHVTLNGLTYIKQ